MEEKEYITDALLSIPPYDSSVEAEELFINLNSATL